MSLTYQQKHSSVKNTLIFNKCRIADHVELLKQELWKETAGRFGLKRDNKPRCYYRRWCINEWFFGGVE